MEQRPRASALASLVVAALITSIPAIAAEKGASYSAADYVDMGVKLAGVIAAGVFFAYKALSGSLAAATSISISVQPIRVKGKPTGLMSLVLERGENYSVLIDRIVVRADLQNQATWERDVPFADIGRPDYYASPRERTQYGIAIPLNDEDVTSVSAVVVLRQQALFSKPAHVFSSIVVPPPSNDDRQSYGD